MADLFRAPRWTGVVLAVLLAGCSSAVTRHDDPARRAAYFSGGGKLAQNVSVSLDEKAQKSLADNPQFDLGRMLVTVKRTLDAKGLLAKTADASLPTIEVVVTSIRVRSSFSAVMFGFMAGSDSIGGMVIARDPAGKEVQRFEVSAQYALGGIGGGQGAARMDWLYQAFADEMFKELTGSAPQ
jgi:hypothetical protein